MINGERGEIRGKSEGHPKQGRGKKEIAKKTKTNPPTSQGAHSNQAEGKERSGSTNGVNRMVPSAQ